MSFIADKQTLEDLNLLGRYKNNSIFRLFDQTVTNGGRQLLEQMFREPLTNAASINERVQTFRYFAGTKHRLEFSQEDFNIMENYLRSGSGSLASVWWATMMKKLRSKLTASEEYSQQEAGCMASIRVLKSFRQLVLQLQFRPDHPVAAQLSAAQQTFDHPHLQWLNNSIQENIPLLKLIRYDHALRGRLQKEMKELLRIIYQFDVNIAVSNISFPGDLTWPSALPAEKNRMEIEGLYHPQLRKAVSNPASFSEGSNMIFLTGANMAGKSTYMKSLGVAVWLAHMGFPVPAKKMEFSVKDGIYSSINVPDDLEHGYSHFYAEVLRVKTVARAVDSGKNLVVIFDELFKGTNVKDAYEATLSITEAFSRHRNCHFIISTHIIEVGHTLKEQTSNIRFLYMPTVMQGHLPTYTYQLQTGITADRQGMLIISNEKILELIQQG